MTPPNERSLFRLAIGFLAGIGVLGAGIAFAPKVTAPSDVADVTPKPSQDTTTAGGPATDPDPVQSATVAPVTPPPPNDTVDQMPITEEDAEVAAPPTDADEDAAAVVPAPKPRPAPAPEPLEVDQTGAFTKLARALTTPTTEIPSASGPLPDAAPRRTISVTKRIVNFRDIPDAPPRKFALPPAPLPGEDTIAKAIETEIPVIEPLALQDVDQPEAPKIVTPATRTASLQTPAAPEPADLPARTNTQVNVTVNSFGRKPELGDTTTSGLLAAVTGADRTPRQGFTTSVVTQDTRDAPTPASQTAPPAPPIATGPAFEAFAVPYEDTGERALLAVILIDPGDEGMDRNFLKNLSFPVTFAVPATGERAQFIDAEYRAKGFEVVAMVPPEGPTSLMRRDRLDKVAEVMPEYRRAVPGAIGLMDHPGGELHQNSRLMRVLADDLATSGHAILTNKQRINNSDRIAQDAGVAFAKILRPIDADGTTPSIRRALERAALTASKAGGAVIVGHSDPQTIKTLYEWLLSNSARSINVAPVSAVIKRLGNG